MHKFLEMKGMYIYIYCSPIANLKCTPGWEPLF